MANTPTRLVSGALGTAYGTVYTVAAGKTVILKQAIVANTTGAAINVTIAIAGSYLLNTVSIPANSSLVIPLTQVIVATEVISANGSAAGLHLTISGVVSP